MVALRPDRQYRDHYWPAVWRGRERSKRSGESRSKSCGRLAHYCSASGLTAGESRALNVPAVARVSGSVSHAHRVRSTDCTRSRQCGWWMVFLGHDVGFSDLDRHFGAVESPENADSGTDG